MPRAATPPVTDAARLAPSPAAMVEIDWEPRFVEEVVRRALASRPEARRFYREREAAYRIPEPEARARAFDTLHALWFERLGAASPILGALGEQPVVVAGVARCAVGRPLRRADAGAELLVRSGAAGEASAGRLLRLLLAPDVLLDREAAIAFLRGELQHVADMLDPAFGYEPTLPATAVGPMYDRLLRDRYRVVWNASVDGRLVRRRHLPPSVREKRRAEFAAAFPGLGADTGRLFARFFDDPAPTHAAIVAFVTAPRGDGTPPDACPLCGFPGADLDPDLAALPGAVAAEIHADFPRWVPADGCCRQCADLYRARPLAVAAAAALPGIR